MMLFWIDLETTGLDPEKCDVLEVAFGTSTVEAPFFLTNRGGFVLHHALQPDDTIDPFVINMHRKNGLWAECKDSVLSVGEVERMLIDVVPQVDDWEDKPTLAGNCVGFDHSFLKRHMPTLAARFHYRYYDVSSVKLFCRSLGMEKLPAGESHRAMDDVLESVEHVKKCAEWLVYGTAWRALVKP